MNPLVTGILGRPPHLITRRAALAAGLTERELQRLVRTRAWLAVRRGVYADQEFVATLRQRSEVQRLYDDAAALATSIAHVRSHESAAVVWDMAIPLEKTPTSHFTVPLPVDTPRALQRCRLRNGVKHHLAPFGPFDRPTMVDGVPVLARTAADLAREHGLVTGVCGVDAALRAGTSRAELVAVARRMENWPHVTTVRQAIELGDPGSESIIETLGRLLLSMLGRGCPESQFELGDGRRTAFVDLRLGRHLVEADGREKYDRGLADGILPQDVVWEEKKRQDWLCGYKLGMSRLTWSDVWSFGQPAVLDRLEREVADTDSRFGTDIADLAPYIVKRRRPAA